MTGGIIGQLAEIFCFGEATIYQALEMRSEADTHNGFIERRFTQVGIDLS